MPTVLLIRDPRTRSLHKGFWVVSKTDKVCSCGKTIYRGDDYLSTRGFTKRPRAYCGSHQAGPAD